jgi:heptose III glucuronosyltransferase
MSAPLLTLVVPVYNVAPYLPRCLESLAALSPPADEIIVVDDGSTDECPRILAEFASRLPQMRVIRQENGGLSAARNTALEVATGTYLAFVDSDDFVSPDAYAEALRLAQDDGLDMVLLNANYHFEGREPDYPIYANVAATEVITGREWLRRRFRAGRFLHMVWMHLYRRDFIEAAPLPLHPAPDPRGRDLDHRGIDGGTACALHRPHRRALPDSGAPLQSGTSATTIAGHRGQQRGQRRGARQNGG